jgi:hypothetical protein
MEIRNAHQVSVENSHGKGLYENMKHIEINCEDGLRFTG